MHHFLDPLAFKIQSDLALAIRRQRQTVGGITVDEFTTAGIGLGAAESRRSVILRAALEQDRVVRGLRGRAWPGRDDRIVGIERALTLRGTSGQSSRQQQHKQASAHRFRFLALHPPSSIIASSRSLIAVAGLL